MIAPPSYLKLLRIKNRDPVMKLEIALKKHIWDSLPQIDP